MDTAQWLQTVEILDENQICLFCGNLLTMPAPVHLPLRDKTKRAIRQDRNRHHLVPQRYYSQPYRHSEDIRAFDQVSGLVGVTVGVHPECHIAFNRQYDKNAQVGFRHFFARMQRVNWGYLVYMLRGQP